MSEARDAIARLQQGRTRMLFALHRANRGLLRHDRDSDAFWSAKAALDRLLVYAEIAKWHFGRMDGSYTRFAAALPVDADSLARARMLFEAVTRAAQAMLDQPERSASWFDGLPEVRLTGAHEMQWAGAVPLLPTICPVVLLQGSQRAMGRQYARQICEIYGPWIFRQIAAQELSDQARQEVARWEAELARYMPDIVAFAEGMAEGLNAAGVAVTREVAVSIWTGVRPPAKESRPMSFAQGDDDKGGVAAAYLGTTVQDRPAGSTEDLCSGICAWGAATRDGSLIAGASTDHDCTFQATIVAFPEGGHPYIYTPFSANGSIPVLGEFHMAGHPGMNAMGLAYVHHGGANTGEPVGEWGYGIRRGPATFHVLQHCASAAAAETELRQYPVGDSGISLGSIGGIFADAGQGFSLECRAGAPFSDREIIRRGSPTRDGGGRLDFLYANNNALAPESAHLNCPPAQGYEYTIDGGWFTLDWAAITADPGPKYFRRHNTRSSEGRNRYAYRMMAERYGQIDLAYMRTVYRTSGTVPAESFEAQQASWRRGERWNSSVAHRGNAFTAVLAPRRGDDGAYLACIGPADRFLQTRGPEHGYHYPFETNTFLEIRLRGTPQAVAEAALECAAVQVRAARRALGDGQFAAVRARQFQDWVEQAEHLLVAAGADLSAARDLPEAERLALLARATRRANVAQVRGRQVHEDVR